MNGWLYVPLVFFALSLLFSLAQLGKPTPPIDPKPKAAPYVAAGVFVFGLGWLVVILPILLATGGDLNVFGWVLLGLEFVNVASSTVKVAAGWDGRPALTGVLWLVGALGRIAETAVLAALVLLAGGVL